MARPKGVKARIDHELAKLRATPREVAAIDDLLKTDPKAVYETALHVNKDDTQLKETFTDAGLDPTNPFHWRKLVQLLAALRSQKSGPPLLWGAQELCQLMIDVQRLREEYPKKSVEEICTKLIEENERYANLDVTASTPRRKWYDGLDEKMNPLLKNLLDGRNEQDWLKSREGRVARQGFGVDT
jgi:hypothetical protein